MTVGELAEYFSDREFFTDPDREVRFVLVTEGVPFKKGTKLEMRGSLVSDQDEAIVALCPASKRKYRFSLKIEASPVIEAESLEEAKRKACELMRHRAVVDTCTGDSDEGYVAQEPHFLKEVKE